MQPTRLGPPESERPAARTADGVVHDLNSPAAGTDGTFLAADGTDRAGAGVGSVEPPCADAADLRVGSPIARPAGVVRTGPDRAARAAGSGADTPEKPAVFSGRPGALAGPDGGAAIPADGERTGRGAELAVAVGRRTGRPASPGAAPAHVTGHAAADAPCERDRQPEHSGGQRPTGTCAPGFDPLGSWLVPAGEAPEPQTPRPRSRISGGSRQDSAAADMIFPVARLVRRLGQCAPPEPGDVIGIPGKAAVPGRFPRPVPSDVEREGEGLGRQRQVVIAGAKEPVA
ncbi:Ureidoglycolate lyase [Streptomyces sp. enrichment culture]|uniref:fumarylacetoacetate hydrolase family protein n=1 Tax=Streptomyces sp. enrichment culture TaxID=1795815 RepID=UPI003F569696